MQILSFLINTLYSLRIICVEIILATRAHKENRKRISDEALNESVGTLNRNAGPDCRRPSTSTSRKQLTSDTDNATELYAAYFRMTMKEGKMIHADTGVGNGCVEENVNRLSGEISIAFHHCRAIAISVLMLILQLTSTPKSPLLPAILNDLAPALAYRHRWAGSNDRFHPKPFFQRGRLGIGTHIAGNRMAAND